MNLSFLKLGERIRNKIFAGVALVAVIPFIISGAFSLYLMNRAHNDDVLRSENSLLNQKAVEIKKFIFGSNDALSVVPPSSGIQGVVTVLKPDEKTAPGEIVAITQNRERVKYLIPPDDLSSILKNILDAYPSFNELYIIDAKSGIEASYQTNSGDLAAGREYFADLSKLPQFQSAVSGKSYTGSVNFTLAGPVIEVASPLTRQDGKVIGVLAGQLNLRGLKNFFAATSLGNTGYIYLLDSGGNIIYHSDQSKSVRANFKENPVIAEYLAGKTTAGSIRVNYRSFWGEKVTASAISLNGAEKGLPWLLVAEWPVSDANRIIDTLRNQFIFFLMAVLILTLFLSIFLANKIAAPISVLQTGTARIANGVFDAPVDIRTNDELEDLGQAFNKMMAGLKQLQELKDEFVFIAAHELRTPVAAIKGYLSMIMDGEAGKIDDVAKEFVKKVANANQRLIQLVNDLLQVARSEAGRLTIQVAAIDVVEPIKSVLDELNPLAAEKNIKMTYDPQPALPKISADAARLKEVLVNLVGNAIKYTIGSGAVTISHEIKGNAVVTHIADTGIGISEEARKKLFEKFYRVQTEKTREITGTGLGLFIVKQIIGKMSGEIWVESEEGKGSVFSFSLPIAS